LVIMYGGELGLWYRTLIRLIPEFWVMKPRRWRIVFKTDCQDLYIQDLQITKDGKSLGFD
jgi:hypothetical protein